MKKGKVKTDEELAQGTQEESQELAEATTETPEEVETTANTEETEEALELDWKAAGRKLKSVVDDIMSIDNYFRKPQIELLRTRYNGKERTEELYNAIMKL